MPAFVFAPFVLEINERKTGLNVVTGGRLWFGNTETNIFKPLSHRKRRRTRQILSVIYISIRWLIDHSYSMSI